MASKSQSPRGSAATAGGSGRRRPPPPPVSKPKPWGLIAGALALAVFIGGMLAYAVANTGSESVRGEAAALRAELESDGGVQVFEDLARGHVEGPVDYAQTPPAGGDHNAVWQSCQGTVYTDRIADEHAVHSLEHGAVWIAHQPDLADDQVQTLAGQVQGTDYLMMSPYPDLPSPVVLTAWGRQLAVDSADDPRVGEFIRAYRVSASQEPGATCSSPLTVQGVDAPLTQEQLSQVSGAAPMEQSGS